MIVAPRQCYVPPSLEANQRLWGLALQLYSLSSDRNWGCGDFTDLGRIVEWAGKVLGAGVIGLNPLHALRNNAPYHISPYAPYSRLYLNELYIDLERLPEFYRSEKAQQQFLAPEFQVKLQALRESRQVDYDAIAAAKRTMLDFAYRKFLTESYSGEEPNLQPKTARAWLLERFIQSEGTPLEVYATFQTLEEERRLIQSKSVTWHDWPKKILTPGQPICEYAKRHRKRVRFFQYIQWVASEQLNEIRRTAEQLAMPIGLYHDLALGADRNGAEAWIKSHILRALQRENLLPPGVTEDPATAPAMTTELCRAIHLYLARTPSCLVLANLEDGLDELSQTNLPGTVDTHPNWTRKYLGPVRVDEMLGDERLRQLGAALRSTRPLG